MLGILQVNEGKSRNKICASEIIIEKIKFFEVIVDLKQGQQHFLSKMMINRAMRLFVGHKVLQICAKKCFCDFLEKNNLEFVSHFDILYAKRFEILKMIDKKTVFVHSKKYDISDMVDFLARNFDDVFLDIKVNEKQIKQRFLAEYGVSVADFNAKYKRYDGVFVCYDRPKSFFYGDLTLNLSKEKFDVPSIDDVVCKSSIYQGNTDVTALFSVLVKNDLALEKKIYIKNIVINT